METTDRTLAAKLAAKKNKIRGAVAGVVKNGNNKMQNYKFAQEVDVVLAMRKEMIDAGVDFSMEATSAEITHGIPTKSGEMKHFLVNLVCSLTDAETGYTEHSKWVAGAADSGDKAIQKALTSGEKYFLMKTFLLPTGDDLEAFEDVDKPPVGNKQPQQSPEAQLKPDAKPPAQPMTPHNKVMSEVWSAYQKAHEPERAKGWVWSYERFAEAVRTRGKGRLPDDTADATKVFDFVNQIPSVECLRSPDETKAAA